MRRLGEEEERRGVDAATDFFRALEAADTPSAVLAVFDDEARRTGAVSTSFGYVLDGRRQPGWSTTPEAWRRIYRSPEFDGADPEFRPETRLDAPALIRFAMDHPGAEGDPWARGLYDAACAFGFTAVMFLPDRTPEGIREMATLNVMLDIPEHRLDAWHAEHGAILELMASTVHARLRRLRGVAVETSPLSLREIEVLRLLAAGDRPARIAALLDISEKTVEFHIGNARAKLGARTRDQAVAIAAARGWLGL